MKPVRPPEPKLAPYTQASGPALPKPEPACELWSEIQRFRGHVSQKTSLSGGHDWQVGGAGAIALLAAAKWLSGRHARRRTKTVAARVERKRMAEGELGPAAADMLTAALRPQQASQVPYTNRSSRSAGGSPYSQHTRSSGAAPAPRSPAPRSPAAGAPSPAGFRTDGRVAPVVTHVVTPVVSPRPDASPATAEPSYSPAGPTSPAGPISPAGPTSPAAPPRPAHLLEREASRGAGGLAPDARLQARSRSKCE